MSSQAELDEVVDVQITRETVPTSRVGFGTALLAAEGYTGVTGDVVNTYGSLSEVLDDGFDSDTDVYKAAAAYFGQALTPRQLIIGHFAPASTLVSLNAIQEINNDWYALMVIDTQGTIVNEDTLSADTREDRILLISSWIETQHKIFLATAFGDDATDATLEDDTDSFPAQQRAAGYTRSASLWADGSEGAEGLTQLITNGTFAGGATGWTVTQGTGNFAANTAALTTGATNPWTANLQQSVNFPEAKNYKLTFDVLAAGVGQFLRVFVDAVLVYDEASAVGTVEVEFERDAAGAVNLNILAFNGASQSTITLDNISIVDQEGFTVPIEPVAAWLGRMLPTVPGEATWAHKTLSGVTAAALTAEQRENLTAKGVNQYVEASGVSTTRWGTTATGEYLDVIHGIDWLEQNLQEAILRLLVSQPKVGYTDAGIAQVESQVRAQLMRAQAMGIIAPDSLEAPGFAITVPPLYDTDVADRAARLLQGVRFTARLAGAVHKTVIRGAVAP